MKGENRMVVTDEPDEFEEWPVGVEDLKKLTHHFRGIYRIYRKLVKTNQKITTCNLLDLQTSRFWPIVLKNLPSKLVAATSEC